VVGGGVGAVGSGFGSGFGSGVGVVGGGPFQMGGRNSA
jgi:hypothetical protein